MNPIKNENRIDRRISYKIMLDTETCNTLVDEKGNLNMSNVLVYDLGFAVIDKRGKVYESHSLIIKDIFFEEKELMKSSYYAMKIPMYLEPIAQGERKVVSFYEARQILIETMKKYETNVVVAHNSYFDYNALTVTQRWLTKSKYRTFFPSGTEIWDTMKMARDVVAKTPTYIRFCQENGYLTKRNQVRLTAEILYRYISKDNEFVESHTGLEDVEIERQILAYCFRKHKAMRKKLFS